MRLLISGGGTGGHVYPALVVVREIRKQADEYASKATLAAKPRTDEMVSSAVDGVSEFLYLGQAGAIEERLAQANQIAFQAMDVGGVRGLAPWTAARNLSRLIRSVDCVRSTIRTFKPEAVLSTGGYVSAPVIWASAAEHVRSVIYLPDLEPGWAVRATAPWATRIAVSFREAVEHLPKGKAVVTGYPVRSEFFKTDRARARRMFHLDPTARTVTIFGGSRGAHHINQAAVASLDGLTRLAQIVLITGREDEEWANQQVQSLSADLSARVRVYGYLEEQLPHALAAADVVVARAGAATLGEFPALGLPAIVVPYPHAGQHQERNADFLVERGAAIKVKDEDLDRELVSTVSSLLNAPEKIKTMAQASHAIAEPHAAENLVALLNSLAGERQ